MSKIITKTISTSYGDVKVIFRVMRNKHDFELIVPKGMTSDRYNIFLEENRMAINQFKRQCINENNE